MLLSQSSNILFSIVLWCIFLTGCGNKSELYLQKQTPQNAETDTVLESQSDTLETIQDEPTQPPAQKTPTNTIEQP